MFCALTTVPLLTLHRMLLLAKIILQLFLFTVFLFLYGLPALKRLDRKRTIVLESRKKTDGVKAPSITIVAQSPETGMGWKVTSNESREAPRNDILKVQCKNFQSVEQCLDADLFAKTDFIKDVLVGYDSKISILDAGHLWKSDFTYVKYGWTYTVNPNIKIGPNAGKDQILLLLNCSFIYDINIHQKNFFVMNYNQMSLPFIHKKMNPHRSENLFYKMSATEHIELNVPEDPCEDDENYEFTVCVKNNLANKVGCRPSWDVWSDKRRNVCTEVDQHRLLRLFFHTFFFF